MGINNMEHMKKYKAVVFDMGGTLMEYEGMPMNWSGYYRQGFERVAQINGLDLSDEAFEKACEVMRSFNPRFSGKTVEIEPETIFSKSMESWEEHLNLEKAISAFFSGLDLKPRIYGYTPTLLAKCKELNMKVACLTDLPTGMPDSLFQSVITDIIKDMDLYVSSSVCGFRKPCKETLQYASAHLHIELDEILFVGDEEKDLRTAENAVCDFMYIDNFLKTYDIQKEK